jgi:exosome complex component RRP41
MQHSDILAIAGLRVDGRRNIDIRQIQLKIGVANAADGSSYFEQGLNKVLAIVHGPHELQRRGDDSNEKGSLSCRLINAPFSAGERRKRRAGDRKTLEMETIIRQTFDSVVMLELYARSEISVVIHVLESDG